MIFERPFKRRDGLQQGVVLCYCMQQILLPSNIQAPATVPVGDPGSENHRGHGDGVSDEVVIPVHHDAWELHVDYLRPAGVKMLLVPPPLFVHGNATSELGRDNRFQIDHTRPRAQILHGDLRDVAHAPF